MLSMLKKRKSDEKMGSNKSEQCAFLYKKNFDIEKANGHWFGGGGSVANIMIITDLGSIYLNTVTIMR